MQCPIDGTTLVMTDRSGVEIDYCPQCRGVWLDRGELDKIIESSAGQTPPPQAAAPAYPDPQAGYARKPQGRKRRGGFLEDIFDF
ncbi:zf-TFIIB domain-containing protein [Sedimentitalea sp. JM2-8]|uniref:Zf-TFIIB domain-containing protein n=1 Tax=Sedimentitalea xiamensis TaxID=3050037 RepID=A0ABT7FKN5_9RHOB|nr:zf-TFIIB domain-containing protein [Sedimentitalea xiamensis]MDK3075530.1 zf-TFIIB domain-containing protein [Sedimentitalea xiamensis]